MASSGLKIMLETGDVCPVRIDKAPRAGTVRSGFESFWRLAEELFAEGSKIDGAVGFSFAFEENREMVVSEEALRMRFEGAWTARSSTAQR